MVCCTYYNDSEVKFHEKNIQEKDAEMFELLTEANKLGGKYFVDRREYLKKPLFKKSYTEVSYELLHDVGFGEYQVINFVPVFPDPVYTSFGMNAPRATVMNYLMGFVNGALEARKSQKEKKCD